MKAKCLVAAVAVLVLALGVGSAQASPIQIDPTKAVLVVEGTQYAYVGWYGAYEFPPAQGQAWTILMDVVKQGTGNSAPAGTNILLFTADGTSNPDNAGNLDAGTIYNRLAGEGYHVTVANQAAIATMTDFSAYNLVMYPNLDDRSAANVVNSGVHFITMEPGQTDEMGIGTGVSTYNDWAQNFVSVDAGALVFDNAVRTEAITAAGQGQVLVSLPVPEPMTMTLVLSGITGLAWFRRRN